MTKRHPTIGGNQKPAQDAPPMARKKRKKKIVVPKSGHDMPDVKLVCDCGVGHVLYLTEGTLMAVIPCKCGALLRYYAGSCTIEEVDGLQEGC